MARSVSDVSLGWMETAVNRLLEFDPDTRARLAALAGRVICLEVRDAGAAPRRVYVAPAADALRFARAPARVDVTISGSAATFARRVFARAGTPVAGELQISGDVELGQRFQQILQALDIDGEEMLARWFGDVPARQLGNIARASRAWVRHAGATLAQDVAEYLQEEAFVLAKRERIGAFLRAVDALRADVDRLERRMQRLIERR